MADQPHRFRKANTCALRSCPSPLRSGSTQAPIDYKANWIDTTGVNPLSKLNFNSAPLPPATWNNYTAWAKLKKTSSTFQTWNGCVETRMRGTAASNTDYNVNDVAPTSALRPRCSRPILLRIHHHSGMLPPIRRLCVAIIGTALTFLKTQRHPTKLPDYFGDPTRSKLARCRHIDVPPGKLSKI